jgi:photosystem II stability/assembly factor-like uncharacterized protein
VVYGIAKRNGVWEATDVVIDVWLDEICAIGREGIWGVGEGGMIMRSDDGGGHWRSQDSGTTQDLYGMSSPNGDIAWVVGGGGTVLKTLDGGSTWSSRELHERVALSSISALDADTAWAAGSFRKKTLDGDDAYPEYAGSVVLKTGDGGTNWDVVWLDFHEDIGEVAAIDGDVAWVIGHYGAIARTTDGGVSWQDQSVQAHGYLNDIFVIDANRAWIVGSGGTILYTDDGGYSENPAP